MNNMNFEKIIKEFQEKKLSKEEIEELFKKLQNEDKEVNKSWGLIIILLIFAMSHPIGETKITNIYLGDD
jgi:Glu-tRNA(Gln) amidotransferase subunit E-like FAD-binding protein